MHIFVAIEFYPRKLRFPHRNIEQEKKCKFQMKLFLNANMHTPRVLIQKKECLFVTTASSTIGIFTVISATISHHFYFKYKYTYGTFAFEQFLI